MKNLTQWLDPSGDPSGFRPGQILINDLPDQTRSKVRLFVDETAIYLTVSNLQDAQTLRHDLDHLNEWELQWAIQISALEVGRQDRKDIIFRLTLMTEESCDSSVISLFSINLLVNQFSKITIFFFLYLLFFLHVYVFLFE